MPIINLSQELLDSILGAIQSAVELSREDDKRIARAPQSDGYTVEDVEHARAYTASLEATQAAIKQAAEQADELGQEVEDALSDACAYRVGDADPGDEDSMDETDVEFLHKWEALAERLGLHPTF